MIGETLSHYRITAALGAGGMGEVYRATDTNLNRQVAIKVLPPEVAGDRERLARFQREAHLLAALNHPNIAAIYGLEEADGKPFLALELVEGEDLKERLARGRIPVGEALEIAEQIAEALEEAHNKGIVHRDLKPANVKITPEGKVKVLDFGLAKAWGGEVAEGSFTSPALSQSPTLAQTGTVAGVILGTAAYMSPEQARGKPVDRRADVWSFGVLLWEMLSGRSLFTGETVTDIIAAVVRVEPDLEALPAETPGAVRRLLGRCLRKDPRLRLPDMGAARLELQEVMAGTPEEREDAPAARKSRAGGLLAWSAFAAAIAVAALLAYVHLTEIPEPRLAARFAFDPPEGWSVGWGWPIPSPDGRQIVFGVARDNAAGEVALPMLWVRSLESLEPRPIPGTEGVSGVPFWSPDGQMIGFFTGGELRKLRLSDGTVQRVCAVPQGGNFGDWNENGAILFSAGGSSAQLFTVAASGGDAKVLMAPDPEKGEMNLHMPQLLPDGRQFVFLVGGSQEASGAFVSSLDSPNNKRLLAPGWVRRVYMSGYLLFAQDGTLLAQPFDAERAELSGDPVAVASSVAAWNANPGIGWFDVSPGGTLAYLSGQVTVGEVQLAWLDSKGNPIERVGVPANYGQIALSPDERSAAVEIFDPGQQQYDLWVMDLARGVTSRVTASTANERDPVWAPDGRSLAFVARSEEGAGADLRRKGLQTSDPESVLTDSEGADIPESWSRDGKVLLLIRQSADGLQSVWALSLDGEEGEEPVLDTGFNVDEPQLSPDGLWLAYLSRESGRDEVYLEPFRREGNRVRVSVNGGGQPKWRADGKRLFFTDLAGMLMAVDVDGSSGNIEVSLPEELFQLRGFQGAGYDDYSVSSDGQRFLVKLPVDEEERQQQVRVVLNWTSLLK